MSLARALELDDRELVSFVGAGGKKTAMDRLIDSADERALEVIYSTTTHMPPPESIPLRTVGAADLSCVLAESPSPAAVADRFVREPERVDAKVRGFDPAVLSSLFDEASVDWLLVKADGARMREFKAPGPDEPRIPAASSVVVPVASTKAIGRPVDRATVHRVEQVASITGLSVGDELTPAAVGRVLAHSNGGRKRVPRSARVVPLVNKADTEAERRAAQIAVETALERTTRFERGLVTSFEHDIIDVVS